MMRKFALTAVAAAAMFLTSQAWAEDSAADPVAGIQDQDQDQDQGQPAPKDLFTVTTGFNRQMQDTNPFDEIYVGTWMEPWHEQKVVEIYRNPDGTFYIETFWNNDDGSKIQGCTVDGATYDGRYRKLEYTEQSISCADYTVTDKEGKIVKKYDPAPGYFGLSDRGALEWNHNGEFRGRLVKPGIYVSEFDRKAIYQIAAARYSYTIATNNMRHILHKLDELGAYPEDQTQWTLSMVSLCGTDENTLINDLLFMYKCKESAVDLRNRSLSAKLTMTEVEDMAADAAEAEQAKK